MIVVALITVLFVFVTYGYIRWTRLKQYWAKRGVAHTPPHPLLGSLTFIHRENISLWFRRIYHYCKEPYIGIWIFWRPALLVNSPDVAKNILVKHQSNFRNRLASSGSTDPIGRLNIFSLDDPVWSVIRKHLSPLFTGSKLRGIQSLVCEKSKELVERIGKERKANKQLDLRNIMTDFSTDIIGTSSFGVVSDATRTGESHLRIITQDFMKFNIFRALSWFSAFFIPELVDLFSTDYMRKILRQIVAQRGGFENKVTDPRDLLDILIKAKQEGGEELDMTEDMMIAQAAVFLQAGFDTTALTLSFAIYELAFSPKVQEMLCKELQQAKELYGEDIMNANVLAQLTYLNCVIKETLRKYPGLPWLDRIALEDYQVDDNLTIKAGTPVYVNTLGMHYDPEFFSEPDKFDPDRFLPEKETSIKPFTYMPFGEGPRKCIGQRLGLLAVRHGLTAIMLNYEIRKLPNTPQPSDIKMDTKALNFAPKIPLSVEFVDRM